MSKRKRNEKHERKKETRTYKNTSQSNNETKMTHKVRTVLYESEKEKQSYKKGRMVWDL